jgi:hypothetical protein
MNSPLRESKNLSKNREEPMEPRSVHKSASAIGLATIVVALLLGSADNVAAQTVPSMTIKIYNNTDKSKTPSNIYPVLTTGTSSSSLWLQAWLKVPKAQMGDKPYPKLNNFRIYINPAGNGIPPGGAVTLQLPLLTQLVATNQVDPKKTDQYIDWWGGGRVELFEAPAADGKPPAALAALFNDRPSQTKVTPIASTPVPRCADCQPLTIFKDTGGVFKNNEPSQLTEYTLGAINQNKDPVELNSHNVDFDVSYVDTAFLPAAMVPFNTVLPPIAQVGYVGTPQPIDTFRKALNKFIAADSPYRGWPQFVDGKGNRILKLPSVLHAMAGDPDMTPKPWLPIEKLSTNWKACLPDNPSKICIDIRAVRQLFLDNYANYKAVFPSKCDAQKGPVELTEDLVISHVYGFTPFGENCPSPTVNLLENTPGYAADNSQKFHQIKDIFDGLQNWKTGEFDPYVVLIHGEDYVNAPNTYAYSVDDAVGNMQADATGFIIAVGGTKGLPNPNRAAPPVNVNFGYGKTDKVRFMKYGICTATPNMAVDPDFPSIGLSVLAKNLAQCPLSLIDNKGMLYTLKFKSGPPYPFQNHLAPNTHAPIDCSGNKPGTPAAGWCDQIYAYSEKPVGRGPDASYVITPAPQQ